MILVRPDAAFAALAARLEERARILAEAHSRDARLGPGNPGRWRDARLLWPLFAKG